jgi:thymidylate synthase ThyX
MGLFGNGRFFETLLQKLNCHNLAEMQDLGKASYTELSKVIPSFIRRGEISHKYCRSFSHFIHSMQTEIRQCSEKYTTDIAKNGTAGVRLVSFDPEAPIKIAAALLFSDTSLSLFDLQHYCSQLSEEALSQILDSACLNRENRRHKSPRALEHASFTFEILADFGVYRDLQRHRLLTQERQLLSCEYDYYVPPEIAGTEMEVEYRKAMDMAKTAYDAISQELPEEAQYVVPMAYNIRWYFHVNLRSLQWLCELRSQAAGHPTYRYIAQEMSRQVSAAIPSLERFFKFVDFDGYDLGRLGAEIRQEEKMKGRA